MNARAHAPRSAEEPRVILALLGLLAAAGLYAFLQSPFFALADVRVEGWRTVPPEEVVALSGVRYGDNLLRVDMPKAAAAVERHPRIERAAVRRRLPGTLVIGVVEYEPLLLAVSDEDAAALAYDGTRIPVTEEEAARLPVFYGEPDAVPPELLRVAGLLPPDIHRRVLVMEAEGGLVLRTRTGETVLLGDGENLSRKLGIAVDLLRQDRYAVIDVRFPASPAVRPAQ